MSETKEFTTLINSRSQLKIGFKKNLVELAGAFQKVGLIDDDCYEEVTPAASFLTLSQKAERISQSVIDSVELSEDKYEQMMKILAANSTIYGDLVRKLDKEYGLRGGTKTYAKATLRVQEQPFQTDMPIWETEITLMNTLNLVRYRDPKTGKKKELRLLDELAPDWEEVGEMLGFTPANIKTIMDAGARKPLGQCMRDLVRRWLTNAPAMPNKDRFPNTWQGVYNLLVDSLHGAAAQGLKDSVDASYSDLLKNFDSAPEDNSSCVVSGLEAPSKPRETPQQSGGKPKAAVVKEKQPASDEATPDGASGDKQPKKRKKMNKEQLTEWLLEQGIDDDDVQLLKGKKVSELLFLKMKDGDKWTAGLSEATMELLPDLQDSLRDM